MSDKPGLPEAEVSSKPEADLSDEISEVRDGRKFQVSNQRGKARSKVRYIEGTKPKSGCRFLS